MSTFEMDPQSNPAPPRQWGLRLLAMLVIVGAIVGWGILRLSGGESREIRDVRRRMSLVATAVREYAKANEEQLPDDPRNLNVRDASGAPADLSQLMTDVATGQPITWRVVTEAGERIHYNFLGERLIAWSPQASYDGKRAVILNGGDFVFALDSKIDFRNQKLDMSTNVGVLQPSVNLPPGEGVESGDDAPEDQASSAPTTGGN